MRVASVFTLDRRVVVVERGDTGGLMLLSAALRGRKLLLAFDT
jgi:hypothetical protein